MNICELEDDNKTDLLTNVIPSAQDDDRLLDFDYTNDDIESLRQQMTLPDAADSPSSDVFGSAGRRIRIAV